MRRVQGRRGAPVRAFFSPVSRALRVPGERASLKTSDPLLFDGQPGYPFCLVVSVECRVHAERGLHVAITAHPTAVAARLPGPARLDRTAPVSPHPGDVAGGGRSDRGKCERDWSRGAPGGATPDCAGGPSPGPAPAPATASPWPPASAAPGSSTRRSRMRRHAARNKRRAAHGEHQRRYGRRAR